MKRFGLLGVMFICLSACGSPVAEQEQAVDPAATYAATGWTAKSLPELAAALQAGDVTAEALTQAYLERIEAVDRNGPSLQAVLSLNPDALEIARALDAKRAAGEPLGPLHGIPILLKDNIESADDLPTTAGSFALADNITRRDSPSVQGLRDSGAIILGKTNLSQWANFRSSDSMSGWSALGGQVRNPNMLDRNPCGSSSGSGAAAAASLAAGTVGTETNGSIICPSNVNGIVGFKPTVGLVSQQYIVPISSTQDTAGPMTKTVTGAAMMLNAMATGAAKTDYVAGLDADALQGKRIGVLRYMQGSNPNIIALLDRAVGDMEAAGAETIDIETFEYPVENVSGKDYQLMLYEFKATLNAYLAEAAPEVKVRTLTDLIAFNSAHADTELALFGQDIFEEVDSKGDLTSDAYQSVLADVLFATRENGISKLLEDYDLDLLVAPSGPVAPRVDPVNGDVWPSWAGSSSFAAMPGFPHLTVPMGQVKDIPVGVSFMAGKDEDAKVLAVGYAYEQATLRRKEPAYLLTAEDRPDVKAAMSRQLQ